MKKALSTISAAATYLYIAAPAFAAPQSGSDSLDPCTGETNNPALTAACQGRNLTLGGVIGFAITLVFVAAVLIALFFLVYGGIKWITSGGDKGAVEAARNQIIAAVIGLIIVFLSFFILNLVLGFFGLSLFDLRIPVLGQ